MKVTVDKRKTGERAMGKGKGKEKKKIKNKKNKKKRIYVGRSSSMAASGIWEVR